MFGFIVRLFIKDYGETQKQSVREKYGLLSGSVGIAVNILLSAGKLAVGSITGSIAIIADAANNLSDAGSCAVTIFGFKLASRKPDKEHPFGHGRLEYVAALIVGFIVELVGIELIKSSVSKIISPEQVEFSAAAVAVLLISIAGKLYLAFFNRYLAKKINSPALSAAAQDSVSDVIATSATLLSLVLYKLTSLPLDGYFGVIVACFIMYSGVGILKESIGIILGAPPKKQIVDELVAFINSHEGVLGIHDLVIHSYGEGRMFGSVHVEVSSKDDILRSHDTLDRIEKQIHERFGILMVAHLDPIETDNERVNALYSLVRECLASVSDRLSMHDFRVVEGVTHTNLIFDVVVPFDFKLSDREIKEAIEDSIKKIDDKLCPVITTESSYV